MRGFHAPGEQPSAPKAAAAERLRAPEQRGGGRPGTRPCLSFPVRGTRPGQQRGRVFLVGPSAPATSPGAGRAPRCPRSSDTPGAPRHLWLRPSPSPVPATPRAPSAPGTAPAPGQGLGRPQTPRQSGTPPPPVPPGGLRAEPRRRRHDRTRRFPPRESPAPELAPGHRQRGTPPGHSPTPGWWPKLQSSPSPPRASPGPGLSLLPGSGGDQRAPAGGIRIPAGKSG